ncbi:ribosomal protein subunit S27 [Schizosaccharomyces cryophilus OY26]|uniref:Small ribosomal subunit protein mS33 n=1 Tax=Schizosaccharomyces cryophilus (strain OY26 / ATCC MYA-4695 / CBS 11777 / NBRC 106824 / NRRL Y48691) TaxID=653667 RepID=S9W5Y9_SCHCR|nr:ribosomal protein subunit S27 [Schizosaccharomyces cryophilus OY26]EPY53979.1 ribosomal protein subunit S27 [Schizosaccharomyces cryophilus OY26]
MLKREILEEIKQVSAKIFGTNYKANNSRAGNKFLQRKLHGPRLANYYPSKVPISRMREIIGLPIPNGQHTLRMEVLEEKARKGKGPAKRGSK